MELENKIAVVTGGGQGIGQQIALRLAQLGAAVIIADINEEGSHQTQEMIAQSNDPKAVVVPTDVRQEAQVTKMIEATLGIDQRIDILVNNSGIMGPVKFIEDITVEEWEETMAVNLRGMFLCCKHTIPVMKKQGTRRVRLMRQLYKENIGRCTVSFLQSKRNGRRFPRRSSSSG